MNITLKAGEITPAELLDLCKSVNELTIACGAALQLRGVAAEQQANVPEPQTDGSNDAGILAKTSRKLTATAITLAETSALLSSYIGSIVGVPSRPDPRR